MFSLLLKELNVWILFALTATFNSNVKGYYLQLLLGKTKQEFDAVAFV